MHRRPAKEQAMARAVWSGRVDQLRSELRLDRLYAERSYRYAELDERGEVVVRDVPATRAPRSAGTKKKAAGR